MKTNLCRPLLLLFLALPIGRSFAADWWKISDKEFATDYAKQATSDSVTDQCTVAWMLFARVNQPQPLKGKSYSTWELWPSNEDTFSPAVSAFAAGNKVRNRPHLQQSKVLAILGHKAANVPPTGDPNVSAAGEEVTRNPVSYQYIMDNQLETAQGAWKRLSTGSNLNFPNGAVEIKGDWASGLIKGAYSITTPNSQVYSLVGLHIAAKVAPTPADPFHSEDPSWFWTTFEFKGNAGLANAQSLLTVKDVLPRDKSLALLAQAGLDKGPFANYVCNGTQIRFTNAKAKNPDITLGNTTMENFSFTPKNAKSPADWKTWKISCHSCHGTGSATGVGQNGGPGNLLINTWFFNNDVIGALPKAAIPAGAKSFDFVWSIWRAN